MGTIPSNSADSTTTNGLVFSNGKIDDLVVRDHTFDSDQSGIEYLRAHKIPQLFQDIAERLLQERPLDSLRFIRNILIHTVIHMQDQSHRHDRNEDNDSTINASSSPAKSDDLNQCTKTSPLKHKPEPKPKTTPHLLPSTTSAAIKRAQYDADQLLVSRTTKHSGQKHHRKRMRMRSNSDSALFPQSSAQKFDSHSRAEFDFDLDFNFNALCKPIDDNNKPHGKDMTVLHTMSSLLQDMNVDYSYKSVFVPSQTRDDASSISPPPPTNSTMFASALSIENILEKQRKKHRAQNNNNDNNADTFSSTELSVDTADFQQQHADSDFQHKQKRMAKTLHTSRSSQTMELSHVRKATATHNEAQAPTASSDDFTLRPSALRRARTVHSLLHLLPPPHDHRHILSLSDRPCFGFDIGGTLTKISFFEPARHAGWNVYDQGKTKFVTSSLKYGSSGIRDKKLSFPWRNGTFHFIHFQTDRMSEAVTLLNEEENLLANNEVFYATGGGAHKYGKFLARQLRVNVRKGDELKCLISGLNFLLTHVSDEVFYLSDPASKQPSKHVAFDIQTEGSVFPYLLVNVGSGVSILKVCSPTQFERVSGTQIGGGTYWGLCRLCAYSVLTQTQGDDDDGNTPQTLTFKKAFALAMKGNAKKVNMLVSDIYGGDYPQCNLPGDLVASAFGKCISMKNPSKDLTVGDIARGLLDAIAMNCAQLAYLNAVRFKITRIIFAGNFLRQNDLSMAMISYAIHYWSQGVMKACFLKHEGYCGSIGVMLLPDDELQDEENVNENENDSQ